MAVPIDSNDALPEAVGTTTTSPGVVQETRKSTITMIERRVLNEDPPLQAEEVAKSTTMTRSLLDDHSLVGIPVVAIESAVKIGR